MKFNEKKIAKALFKPVKLLAIGVAVVAMWTIGKAIGLILKGVGVI